MGQKPQPKIASQRRINKAKVTFVREMAQNFWNLQYPGIELVLEIYPGGKFLNIGWKLGPYHWERDFEILPPPNSIELSCIKAIQVLEEVFKRTAIDFFTNSMAQWKTKLSPPKIKK